MKKWLSQDEEDDAKQFSQEFRVLIEKNKRRAKRQKKFERKRLQWYGHKGEALKEYRDEFYEQQLSRLTPEDVTPEEALPEPLGQPMLHQTVICHTCRELTTFELAAASEEILCAQCGTLLLSENEVQTRYSRELCRVGLL